MKTLEKELRKIAHRLRCGTDLGEQEAVEEILKLISDRDKYVIDDSGSVNHVPIDSLEMIVLAVVSLKNDQKRRATEWDKTLGESKEV